MLRADSSLIMKKLLFSPPQIDAIRDSELSDVMMPEY